MTDLTQPKSKVNVPTSIGLSMHPTELTEITEIRLSYRYHCSGLVTEASRGITSVRLEGSPHVVLHISSRFVTFPSHPASCVTPHHMFPLSLSSCRVTHSLIVSRSLVYKSVRNEEVVPHSAYCLPSQEYTFLSTLETKLDSEPLSSSPKPLLPLSSIRSTSLLSSRIQNLDSHPQKG